MKSITYHRKRNQIIYAMITILSNQTNSKNSILVKPADRIVSEKQAFKKGGHSVQMLVLIMSIIR